MPTQAIDNILRITSPRWGGRWALHPGGTVDLVARWILELPGGDEGIPIAINAAFCFLGLKSTEFDRLGFGIVLAQGFDLFLGSVTFNLPDTYWYENEAKPLTQGWYWLELVVAGFGRVESMKFYIGNAVNAHDSGL